MKKVFGICDLDKSYVEVLTRYIGKKEGREFNVVGFSKVEALADFVTHEKFSVLLISVSFIEELNSIPANEDVVPEDTFILTEDIEPGGFRFPEIYKYQSTESLLRQIEKNLSKKSPKGAKGLRQKSVIGIYSPLGRCGKTFFAINLSKKLCTSSPTLLLSFDRHPVDDIFEESLNQEDGFENLNKNQSHLGISDLLYLSATEGLENFKEKQNIKSVDGFDVILKARCSDDIYAAQVSEMTSLIDKFKKSTYQKIIIDVGCDIRNPEAILDECDEVFVPYVDDEYSFKKLKNWEAEQKPKNSTLFERMKKVQV